jgi:hypothetical protein
MRVFAIAMSFGLAAFSQLIAGPTSANATTSEFLTVATQSLILKDTVALIGSKTPLSSAKHVGLVSKKSTSDPVRPLDDGGSGYSGTGEPQSESAQ